jgi:hypothetical protein
MQFLNPKYIYLAEIHRQIVKMYCEGTLNEGNVRKWYCFFKGGRTSVCYEE